MLLYLYFKSALEDFCSAKLINNEQSTDTERILICMAHQKYINQCSRVVAFVPMVYACHLYPCISYAAHYNPALGRTKKTTDPEPKNGDNIVGRSPRPSQNAKSGYAPSIGKADNFYPTCWINFAGGQFLSSQAVRHGYINVN